MKIETKETPWQPIVVTIETREEAEHFVKILGGDPSNITDDLYWFLHGKLKTE